MSTQERPPAPPETSSRTWRRAFADISDGVKQQQLWAHLGWQDIKQRYRRSVIGPLWITISMGMMVTGLGILYGSLFGTELSKKLPHLAVGFIIWEFIRGCVTEGTEVFISNEGLMKQLPAPLSVHIFRLVWRQTLFFLHNLVIYFVLLAIFWQHIPLSWTVVAVFPALLLIMVNGVWVSLLFGVVSTRFRDIPPVVQSIMTMALFMSPITWGMFEFDHNPNNAWRSAFVDLNPLSHYIAIFRDPLIGFDQHLYHWVIVLACTAVGYALALVVLRNYRARVAYWV
jgi:ABC-2 type transport system permease protein